MTSISGERSPDLERTGKHAYIGRSPRGAKVRIGLEDAAGVFTPGELLQVALAACSAMAADHALANALGEDFTARVEIDSTLNKDEYRYDAIAATLHTDLSGLSPEKAESLTARAHRAIERLCVVGRTLDHGVDRSTELRHAPDVAEGA